MRQIIFKIDTTEKYNSGEDDQGHYLGASFGERDIINIAKLLDVTIEGISFGYSKNATYRGVQIDIKKDRSSRWIDVSIAYHWSDRIKVKTLTAKQVDNIKKKFDAIIESDNQAKQRTENRQAVWQELSKNGINCKNDRYITVTLTNYREYDFCDVDLYFNDDVFACYAQLNVPRSLSYLSQEESEIKEIFDNYMIEWGREKQKVNTAIEIATKHKNKILEYYKKYEELRK